MAEPDEPVRLPDAARHAGVERRASFGRPCRPVVHRAHRHRRQHARRGRRVQQFQAAFAHQHVHRVAGRLRPDGWRGRVTVQRHLGSVQGNRSKIVIIIIFIHSCYYYSN